MDSREIIISLRKIARSINLESKRVQKDYGLSIPQLLTLRHLHQAPDFKSTHKQIMNLLSLNSSTVTGIVKRLEKKGLVARVPILNDKRTSNIILTTLGLNTVNNIPSVLQNQLTNRLEKLPEKDKIIISEALNLLIEAMDIENIEASPLLIIEDPDQFGE